MERIKELINTCVQNGTLKKIVLSKPKTDEDGKKISKCACTLVKIRSDVMLQIQTTYASGGAKHENISKDSAAEYVCGLFERMYGQINVVDLGGNAESRYTKGGKLLFYSKIKETCEKVNVTGQNRAKDYILSKDKRYDFLVALGIQDESGRIKDKKQSKFRQINKFLEIISTVTKYLPNDNIVIWDLCCGKSYLSFAAYYYFNFILNKRTVIYGVDLKKDVIEYCDSLSKKLNYDGLIFLHGDINKTPLPEKPDMVMSLHACDIATDIVLNNAVSNSAGVILSTPCCQHELAERIKSDDLSFILDYPILKQKLSALVTDAIRCKALKESGYDVTCLEFIDPEETPKNTMIKAIKTSNASNGAGYKALCDEFNAVHHFDNLF